MTRQQAIALIKQAKPLANGQRFTSYGCYPVAVYTGGCGPVCADCVRDNWASIVHSTLHGTRDGWAIDGVGVRWEGPSEFCDCGAEIESAYGCGV